MNFERDISVHLYASSAGFLAQMEEINEEIVALYLYVFMLYP